MKQEKANLIFEVLKLHRLGKSITKISKEMGLSRQTVHRYLNIKNELFNEDTELSKHELNQLNKQAMKIFNEMSAQHYDYAGHRVA